MANERMKVCRPPMSIPDSRESRKGLCKLGGEDAVRMKYVLDLQTLMILGASHQTVTASVNDPKTSKEAKLTIPHNEPMGFHIRPLTQYHYLLISYYQSICPL